MPPFAEDSVSVARYLGHVRGQNLAIREACLAMKAHVRLFPGDAFMGYAVQPFRQRGVVWHLAWVSQARPGFGPFFAALAGSRLNMLADRQVALPPLESGAGPGSGVSKPYVSNVA